MAYYFEVSAKPRSSRFNAKALANFQIANSYRFSYLLRGKENLIKIIYKCLKKLMLFFFFTFQPSPISSYCYSWLVISIESKNFITEYEDCLEKQIWTASKVLNLFQNMVARGFVSTLYRGLHIFLPVINFKNMINAANNFF